MTAEQTDLPCCGGLVEAQTQVDDLRRWRDDHTDEQRKTTTRIFERLDDITKLLAERWPKDASWAVSIMAGLLGVAIGASVTLAVVLLR